MASKDQYHHAEQQRAMLEARKVELENLLDKQIVLIEHAQTCLRNEMTGGVAGPVALTPKDADKLGNVTRSLSMAVDTKIKWLNAARKMGELMTPEELDAAAVERLKAMPLKLRAAAIRAVTEHHEAEKYKINKSWHSVSAAALLNGVADEGVDEPPEPPKPAEEG